MANNNKPNMNVFDRLAIRFHDSIVPSKNDNKEIVVLGTQGKQAVKANTFLMQSSQTGTESKTITSGALFPEDYKKTFDRPTVGLQYHQIPTPVWPTISTFWGQQEVAVALNELANGTFFRFSGFMEAVLQQNPRIASALNIRVNTVFGLPFNLNYNLTGNKGEQKRAEKICKIVQKYWGKPSKNIPEGIYFFDVQTMKIMKLWELLLGVSPAEVTWDEVYDEELGKTLLLPCLKFHHPMNLWYNFAEKRFYMNTMEGAQDIFPNDPRWAIWGGERAENRAWILLNLGRSLAIHEVMRSLCQRDIARFNEVHTIPQKKVFVPQESYAALKYQIENQMKMLQNESTIYIPEYQTDNGEKARLYDVEFIWAQGQANFETALKTWELINDDIEILILGRTTQNKVSHYQNKDSTSGIRQDIVEYDSFGLDLYLKKIIDKFVEQNWGSEDVGILSPVPCHNPVPPADLETSSKVLVNIAGSLLQLKQIADSSGIELNMKELFEQYKIPFNGSGKE